MRLPAVILLSVIMVLQACGGQPPVANQPAGQTEAKPGGAASGSPQSPSTSGAPAAPAPATSKPAAPAAPPAKVKESLVIGMPSNPETIDPHQTRAVLTGSFLTLVYESLLTRNDATMAIEPQLATEYRNVDPLTWEFKLRRNVKFSNGEPFDAEAVKFSLERAFVEKLNTSAKTIWPEQIKKSVQVVDSHTVRIKTDVPDPMLANRVAVEGISMMPPKAGAEFREKYVPSGSFGTGPYKIAEFTVGDRLVLERNPEYWGKAAASPRLVWRVIPDAQTRVAALQRNEVDVIVNLPHPLVPTVERDQNLKVYSELGSTVHILFINANQGGPLADKRVRQAMNYAVNREAILKGLYDNRGKLLGSVIARQVDQAIDAGVYPYDPAKAKQLLAEAGQANGFDMTLWQATGRWPAATEAAQAIAGDLEKVGIRAKIQTLEWAEYNSRAGLTKHTDAHYYAFTNLLWDPSYLIQRFLPEYNRYRYYDATGDLRKTIEQRETEMDLTKRKELAAKAQQGLRDEAPWLFLYQLDELFGLNKKVEGFSMRADHTLSLRSAYSQ